MFFRPFYSSFVPLDFHVSVFVFLCVCVFLLLCVLLLLPHGEIKYILVHSVRSTVDNHQMLAAGFAAK